jgi:hypothetical protein
MMMCPIAGALPRIMGSLKGGMINLRERFRPARWRHYNSPPLMGGDKGEGDIFELFTPTSILPLQGGGGCLCRYQIFRV